jgi:hypothetical protein
MPYPKADESKKDYIARFMESSEAQSDFPDEKQRLAVAYSMWERRNGAEDRPWPKEYECNFIEAGPVHYQDLGACKKCGELPNEVGCSKGGECEPTGEHVLVKNEALALMAKSFVGKPVIDMIHKDVSPETIPSGDAEGIVTRVWLDGETGWWKCRFIVWDPETQRHCESVAYSVSCAYEPTAVDSEGGSYHNIDYQQEILDGRYTHLAVVTNPRYEGARIQIVNSKKGKGEKMSWKFWQKGARKNAAPIDPKMEIECGGEKVPLEKLLAASVEEAPKKPEFSDETVLEHEGKEYTLGKLKENYLNKLKKNAEAPADDKCPSCLGSGKKAKENAETVPGAEGKEPGHAEHREGKATPGEKKPLPDMRASEGAPKTDEAEAEMQEKKALELQQAEDAKKAEELKKAEEAKKAEEERKNAEDAKKAEELKKEEERRNAGRRAFADLRNAAHERTGDAVAVSVVSMDERLQKGREKYGSGK